METIVIVVHVLASLAIIGLILLQQGKGAAMGASFGAGASQTLFGSQGSGSFLTRFTAFFSVVFFATSFGLAVIAKDKAMLGGDIGIPLEQEVPVVTPESDVPAAPSSEVPAPPSDVPTP